jgi:hypothetical protein
MPQFFETDYTLSMWVPDRGQIEESNGMPVHLQSRSVLRDEHHVEISRDFRPYSLHELTVVPMIEPQLKYAWLNEEMWVKGLGKDPLESKESIPERPAPPPPVEDVKEFEFDPASCVDAEPGEQDTFHQTRDFGRSSTDSD